MSSVVAWSVIAITMTLAGTFLAFAFFIKPSVMVTGAGLLALVGCTVAITDPPSKSGQGLLLMMALFLLVGMAITAMLLRSSKSRR